MHGMLLFWVSDYSLPLKAKGKLMNIFNRPGTALRGSCAAVMAVSLSLFGAQAAIAADKDWPHYGGSPWNERHADLKQINRNNVAQLTPRIVFQLASPMNGLVGSPLVVDGKLYMPASNGYVHAFDLRTGQNLWIFEHKGNYGPPSLGGGGGWNDVGGAGGFGAGNMPNCCSNQKRGLAYANGTIFDANIDASVIAIDATTGKKKWEVRALTKEEDPSGNSGYNSAPTIVGDTIVIGTSGGETKARQFITAYDQKTGAQVWRWYSIPAPDGSDPLAPDGWWKFSDTTAYGLKLPWRNLEQERQLKDILPDGWKTGGGPIWMPVVYDAELNLIYASIGNPNPDLDGRTRPGDNLFTNSIVAIDATTGKTRWYFQILPHDLWDRDPASPPVVTMLEGRKVVVQAGKIGWLFVLDAKTGEYIRKSETFVPAENSWEVPVAKMGPWVTPGASGGNNWSPISVDQERKVAFVGAVHQPTRYSREATIGPELARGRDKPQNLGGDWQFDAKGSHGVFSAIDLTSGKILWQNKSPTGETEVYLGGVLSTSTGLVFQGEGDGNLVALDAGNGDVMWKFQTGAGVNAPPIAFELDGEEFIAVASGGSKLWGTPYGHSVFVFGLPKVWTPAK